MCTFSRVNINLTWIIWLSPGMQDLLHGDPNATAAFSCSQVQATHDLPALSRGLTRYGFSIMRQGIFCHPSGEISQCPVL